VILMPFSNTEEFPGIFTCRRIGSEEPRSKLWRKGMMMSAIQT